MVIIDHTYAFISILEILQFLQPFEYHREHPVNNNHMNKHKFI